MQWLTTGEFLVKETFDKYREEGGLFYGHWSDEQEAVSTSLWLIHS